MWSWTIKKAKHWRIDAFELWYWRRLFRVPWTARRSNQSILKEISPEYSLEGHMLKLKVQYFCLIRWIDSLEKTLILERLKTWGEGTDRGWDGWMAPPTQWIWVWASFGTWWWIGKPAVLQSMGPQRVRHDWVTKLNWTETSVTYNNKQVFLLWIWRLAGWIWRSGMADVSQLAYPSLTVGKSGLAGLGWPQ